MTIQIGEKIRILRKNRNLSQEVLAHYLGVSFQTVSKWENSSNMPDITLLPAIAAFFEISIDELFDFDKLKTDDRVEKICHEAAIFRYNEPEKAEYMLKNALKLYPGNELLLNNLLYTMRSPDRNKEVVDLCKVLIQSAKRDDVRYDALRILAETYKAMDEYALCKETIDKIPELYFSKLQLEAMLLDGEDMHEAACEQKHLAAEMLLDMILCLADHYTNTGDTIRARNELQLAKHIAEAMADDMPTSVHEKTFPEYYGDAVLEIIKKRLENL